MWRLLKAVVFFGVTAALAYAVFFVPLGGATVAQHAREVWGSRVVQEKVRLVRDGVQDELAQKLERALAERGEGRRAAPPSEISEADRRKLEELLRSTR